jgi:pyridoxal phosphate enzyme (YggS family)
LQSVRARIAAAAEIAGRDPASIRLVAVIKNVPLELVYEALAAGVTDLGENRVQEAAERHAAIRARFPQTAIHFIGHLQRNKVGQAVELFDIIQSVDSERLAAALDEKAGQAGRTVPVLLEVNVSGEAGKYGVTVSAAESLIRSVSGLKNLKIKGLMTMAPIGNAGPTFQGLKSFRDSLHIPDVDLSVLSMGMSDDFEAAIAAGSNLVRIGRVIFQGG